MLQQLDLDAGYAANSGGILVPLAPIAHRDQEYDSHAFDTLREMQHRHFWYVGRHRFLFAALRRELRAWQRDRQNRPCAIDLGGGCGGWVSYLQQRLPNWFAELALADSSMRALELAGPVVGPSVRRYQIDLLSTGWTDRWDFAFLLDVVEHIPDDQRVFQEAFQLLRPGGLLFVTTPALRFFWSYNDRMAHHLRRYSRDDFWRLARSAGFEVRSTRYFMFFLSPLLLLARLRRIDPSQMTPEQVMAHLERTHRIPPRPLNAALAAAFSLETPLGHWVPFPWGTSVLGIFRKPL
jgi:SAM-dependent methyltransferase